MVLVTKQQLQRVNPWGQIENRLRLPQVEMQMVRVPGYGSVKIGQLFHIDQQMVMPCLMANLALGTGRRDTETLYAESDPKRAFNNRPVLDTDKKDPGARRRCVGNSRE